MGLASGPLTSLGVFTADAAGVTRENMNYMTVFTTAFHVVAGGTYRLQFESLTPGASGPVIDSVSIIPEPSTITLCLIGASIVVLGHRRKQS